MLIIIMNLIIRVGIKYKTYWKKTFHINIKMTLKSMFLYKMAINLTRNSRKVNYKRAGREVRKENLVKASMIEKCCNK